MADERTLKDGLQLWQEYAQAYGDFVVEATQHSIGQALTIRERLDQIAADNIKKAQGLSAWEQEIALGAAEAFQAQAQSAAERVAKLLKTAQPS